MVYEAQPHPHRRGARNSQKKPQRNMSTPELGEKEPVSGGKLTQKNGTVAVTNICDIDNCALYLYTLQPYLLK